MSTDMTWQINSTSSEQTEALGHKIGSRLRGGEVFELRSDLGGGKTTFVRGLASGAGSQDAAGSPSFTVSRLYKTDTLDIHHYDFYRLPEAGLMLDEISEVMADQQAVVLIEWAGAVENVLPDERVIMQIQATGENDRLLTIDLPDKYSYLRSEA
ncbi:tRNA (adenosine(37)-N6)-threonylcarbamoyltransferase complex ATPase subunit type 1 TsaE [Candidatus Saccharibacteria bacterium]|nr:tRNA (adenosine(37)-N6)-threonylcarbamoyltransferase complex ATPase subunit type 1 TsaE [Candidatus Saccharibacteria bacterium]